MTATPSSNAKALAALARFVSSHGFAATLAGNAVTFTIPGRSSDGSQHSVTRTVYTLSQARRALGY